MSLVQLPGAEVSELRIAVTGPESGAVEIAARIVTPPQPSGLVMFCVPGMSYGRQYFDLPFPGYSFAAAAAAAGHVVVIVDNLGTGDSTAPVDGDAVTLQAMAAANGAVAERVVAGLRAGTLLSGRLGLEVTSVVGIGHSLGGCLLLLQQARFASFDAICVQGFSNQPLAGVYEDHARESDLTEAERLAWATEHLPPKLWGSQWDELDSYFKLPRENFTGLFYAQDVPAELIAADRDAATLVPRVAAIQTTIPYVSAAAARSVTVPTFLAFGEVDLSTDPLAEAVTYPLAPEVSVLRLGGSAHCHNFASTREHLWQRILAWAPGATPRRQ